MKAALSGFGNIGSDELRDHEKMKAGRFPAAALGGCERAGGRCMRASAVVMFGVGVARGGQKPSPVGMRGRAHPAVRPG